MVPQTACAAAQGRLGDMGRAYENQASLFLLLTGAHSVDEKEAKRRKDGFLRLKLVLFVHLRKDR